MGQDFYRRIEGYNCIGYGYFSSAINGGASLVATISQAPGVVDGFSIFLWGGSPSDYHEANFKLVVDNVTKFDETLRGFLGGALKTSFHGMFAANDVQADNTVSTSYRLPIPYMSSVVFTIKNTESNSISLALLIPYHYGV